MGGRINAAGEPADDRKANTDQAGGEAFGLGEPERVACRVPTIAMASSSRAVPLP